MTAGEIQSTRNIISAKTSQAYTPPFPPWAPTLHEKKFQLKVDSGMARVTRRTFTLQKHWVRTSPEKSCTLPITVAKKTRVFCKAKGTCGPVKTRVFLYKCCRSRNAFMTGSDRTFMPILALLYICKFSSL